jgi:hypothetical protein
MNFNENTTHIELLVNIRDLNKNFFNININVSESFFELTLLGNCKNISNKIDNVQNENGIDCLNAYNLQLFPEYCASKILEPYKIEDDVNINQKSKNPFLEMCKKSKLSDLDKDVAMLCIEKLDKK